MTLVLTLVTLAALGLAAATVWPLVSATPRPGEASQRLSQFVEARRPPNAASPQRIADLLSALQAAVARHPDRRSADALRMGAGVAGDRLDPQLRGVGDLLAALAPQIDEGLAGLASSTFAPDPLVPAGAASPGRPGAAMLLLNGYVLPSMRHAALAGEWDRLASLVRAGIHLAHAEIAPPSLFSAVMQSSLEAMVCLELRRIASEVAIPGAAAALCIDVLERSARPADWLATHVQGEALHMSAQLDDFYGSNGVGLTWAVDRVRRAWQVTTVAPAQGPPSLRERLSNVRAIGFPRRDVSERAILQVRDRTLAWVEHPSGSPPPSMRDVAPGNPALDPSGRVPSGVVQRLEPSASWPLARESAMSSRRRAVAALRLRAYATDRGAWPTTLSDALAPSEQLDPASGVPFRYEFAGPDSVPVLRVASPATDAEPLFPASRPAMPEVPEEEPIGEDEFDAEEP